ncbi:uncharacterized protein B0H18DRAFT_25432 [Fomitopsis serialis]|uniref:uncharacterized protein n=1 Tax=Fomitopsis serialis TaxID=139415 RepID=UPI002007FC85|nr:uncharacterized protein B0H18DRAFT_25432 [Neoantrodia serialis]KAH9932456.1 hypothetical protein B0H18DRAFT_25432 [Neoantrodia serialis]
MTVGDLGRGTTWQDKNNNEGYACIVGPGTGDERGQQPPERYPQEIGKKMRRILRAARGRRRPAGRVGEVVASRRRKLKGECAVAPKRPAIEGRAAVGWAERLRRCRRLHGLYPDVLPLPLFPSPALSLSPPSTTYPSPTMVHATAWIPLSLAALALADPIHVPLSKRATGRRVKDVSRYPAAGDFVRSKYGFETMASKLRKRGETVGTQLTNQVSIVPLPRLSVVRQGAHDFPCHVEGRCEIGSSCTLDVQLVCSVLGHGPGVRPTFIAPFRMLVHSMGAHVLQCKGHHARAMARSKGRQELRIQARTPTLSACDSSTTLYPGLEYAWAGGARCLPHRPPCCCALRIHVECMIGYACGSPRAVTSTLG